MSEHPNLKEKLFQYIIVPILCFTYIIDGLFKCCVLGMKAVIRYWQIYWRMEEGICQNTSNIRHNFFLLLSFVCHFQATPPLILKRGKLEFLVEYIQQQKKESIGCFQIFYQFLVSLGRQKCSMNRSIGTIQSPSRDVRELSVFVIAENLLPGGLEISGQRVYC